MGDQLPPKVASAVNIFRHEKIGRWESATWFWAEDPEYEASVQRIAEGKRDRVKQDALYVRVGRGGGVVNTPAQVSSESADAEFATASRYRWFVTSLLRDGERDSIAYEKFREAFKLVFAA